MAKASVEALNVREERCLTTPCASMVDIECSNLANQQHHQPPPQTSTETSGAFSSTKSDPAILLTTFVTTSSASEDVNGPFNLQSHESRI